MNSARNLSRCRWIVLLPLSLACSNPAPQTEAPNRDGQASIILAEVSQFVLGQFTDSATKGAGTGICLGVYGRQGPVDPDAFIMKKVGDRAKALSNCASAEAMSLTVGPIEWLAPDDVRVHAIVVKESGESRLEYRVVQENHRWTCLGPVIPGWGPL